MRSTRRISLFVLAASSALVVQAAEYDLTIQPALSSVTAEVSAFGISDSDSTAISGQVLADLTPPAGQFTDIHITKLSAQALDDLEISLLVFLLGGVVVESENLTVEMGPGFGVVGNPTTVAAGGAFNQTGNAVQLTGNLNYVGQGVLGGALGSGTVNLLDVPPFAIDLPGTVVDDGSTVTISGPLTFAGEFLIEGITINIAVSGTLVATAPTQSLLSGDVNGDDCVDQIDLNLMLAAFGSSTGQPGYNAAADFNADGVVNQDDLNVLLANFGAGAC